MQTSIIADPTSRRTDKVSRLGLGCSKVGSLGNPTPMEDLRALMRLALDLGVNVFDTADIYGQGDSEREIGRLLAGRRDEAFVITKFGKQFSPAMRVIRPLKPILKPLLQMRGGGAGVSTQRDGVMREDFSPARFSRALEASLRRLKFDYVDAVLLHSPPLEVYADPGVAEALSALKASGKTRHFGASCDHWPEVEAAVAMPGLTQLQLPWDLVVQATETGLDGVMAERGIAVFAREVIRLQPDLAPLDAVARAAMRVDIACVIAGTSKPAHLRELARVCG